MNNPVAVGAALAVALTLSTSALASGALTATMDRVDKLMSAQKQNFSNLKPADIKILRKEFVDHVTAAKNAAKSDYARMSAGKSTEQIDKELWAISERTGTPADVKAQIKTMGGPAKTMQQIDRIAADFSEEVLAGSKQFAQGPVERMFSALVPPAHASLRGTGCSLFVWAVSGGTGTTANYKLCSRWW